MMLISYKSYPTARRNIVQSQKTAENENESNLLQEQKDAVKTKKIRIRSEDMIRKGEVHPTSQVT